MSGLLTRDSGYSPPSSPFHSDPSGSDGGRGRGRGLFFRFGVRLNKLRRQRVNRKATGDRKRLKVGGTSR